MGDWLIGLRFKQSMSVAVHLQLISEYDRRPAAVTKTNRGEGALNFAFFPPSLKENVQFPVRFIWLFQT